MKNFIDTGAGVIDEDYRGAVGVVLLNLDGDLRASVPGALALVVSPATWAFGSVWGKRLPLPAGAAPLARAWPIRQLVQRGRRHGEALGQRARPAVPVRGPQPDGDGDEAAAGASAAPAFCSRRLLLRRGSPNREKGRLFSFLSRMQVFNISINGNAVSLLPEPRLISTEIISNSTAYRSPNALSHWARLLKRLLIISNVLRKFSCRLVPRAKLAKFVVRRVLSDGE